MATPEWAGTVNRQLLEHEERIAALEQQLDAAIEQIVQLTAEINRLTARIDELAKNSGTGRRLH
ncbi:MAG: hypothetical protein H3C34_00875 [Caldilineaceae bacterium]|nr:hypothetical protein [Caldilineaceae bacterium]